MAKKELRLFTLIQDAINYCITITAKSPKRYRGNISDRLVNTAFDVLEFGLRANAINFNTNEGAGELYMKRRDLQYETMARLRMLEQIAFVSKMNNAITNHQYETIALKLAEINISAIAWAKADKSRRETMLRNQNKPPVAETASTDKDVDSDK